MIIIGYSAIIINLYFSFAFGLISVQNIGIDNIQINTILINIAGLIGFGISTFLLDNFPRKYLHYIHIFGIIVSGTVLFSLDYFFITNIDTINGLKSIFSCKL